ncbi:AP-3 complex subunit beta KNAG_0K00350 [Huiozyma naganishii CBS 8797]|uniref:Clathrin/coatomer adaptor adaptin-like N-terminal domain-containing protein n=1 Tax=Huiozyma naganishii (strain ATCC MYA-139 / BCRC 22969 / CBS 8797 / KCTC 17520 / NBRC 10181 / NCYC 3082 / Yp74L-3) TaxID=1071383 RepID=J7RRC0_HUIN7|nr:hypothetical protein KNAG_0K00350 [Kazachstania naganishii CBS 8797]CCK72403.1 hypothetical protein KNAG_0K00350 [Kazachstania naganishii CBS 8797]
MTDSLSQLASALESSRAITMEAAAVVGSKLGETSYTNYSNSLNAEQLRTFLNSRNTREVKDAMKRIISLIVSDDATIDVESFFADVLKNVTSEDPKVRRLVYIYMLRFAEKDPDLSLLSVNSLQKTLNDSDPEIRSFAIKALSDIKIPSLIPIVMLSLKKYITDTSPLVRSEVAYGLLKVYMWKDQEHYREDVGNMLKELLSDSEPRVISAAILTFKECFAQNLDWLHGHYRYFLKVIKQLDSWAQSYLIELLIRYVKKYIEPPTVTDISSNEPETAKLNKGYNKVPFPVYKVEMDPDLQLFLDKIVPLRFRSNPVTVLSCCSAFYQLATPQQFKQSKFPEALLRSFKTSNDTAIQVNLLHAVLLYSKMDSTLFCRHVNSFFVLPTDTILTSCLKLEILATLANTSNMNTIIRELKYYISHSKFERVIISAASTLASCTNFSTGLETHVMKWLISRMESSTLSSSVLDCYVSIIRKLVINDPVKHLPILIKLADILETQAGMADNARAGLIWLFGEVALIEYRICPDILRKLVPSYSDEGVETRNAILLFAAKLLSCEIDKDAANFDMGSSRIAAIYESVLYLAKFDDSFDVRDRARWISSIFESKRYEIAALLFQAPKPTTNKCTDNSFSNDDVADNSIETYFEYIPWNSTLETFEDDIRKETPLKDYAKYKTSISSNSFISGNNMSRSFQSGSSEGDNITKVSGSADSKPRSNNFTSTTGRKYKLQSLDEFFADIPVSSVKNTVPTNGNSRQVRRVIEEEETSSSEEETSGEYETDSGDDSSTEEDVQHDPPNSPPRVQ